MKRVLLLFAVMLFMLSGCAKQSGVKNEDQSDNESFRLSDGRYFYLDPRDVVEIYSVSVPYVLISDGKYTIINDATVSYQPGGDVERNGSEIVLKGIFENKKYCYTFTLTADDTLRFERDKSTVLQSDFEWTDGIIFCNADDPESDKASSVQIVDRRTPLTSRFPEYFDLDASNGLAVIVWQMAANSYSFGLLENSETPREWLSDELLNLRSANEDQMKMILASYDVSEDDIYIIPWQNPVSSYIAECFIDFGNEDMDAKREEYVNSIRAMLFD